MNMTSYSFKNHEVFASQLKYPASHGGQELCTHHQELYMCRQCKIVTQKLLNCLSNMFAAVLFITGIYTAVGFNIFTKPVSKFTNDDPLFRQTIIQSRDRVFVPSPTSGDVSRCAEKICSRINVTGPIASAASWREDTEQFLVCNQVWTMNSSTEYFNKNCTYMSGHQKKSKIYPEKLVLQLLEQNANNNNNNKYKGSQTSLHQDHWRKKRALQDDADTDEDENEDEGTEISFVLDGSGSIEGEDFERAKDFIYNMMKNFWTKSFNCKFAVVQYGRDIRTELSLKENNDRLRALDKVKNIKQIQGFTNTASSLYYVLTDVFVPQHGSKKNAKKMIILLSDGQMLGDERNFAEILNMPQMEGIVRYAIGVGLEVLDKPQVIQEMTEIAGNEHRFFSISNYASLKNILSSLEKSIIGIEGKAQYL
ncbi:integrin alpha-E-like [Pangasianodon hypophthalmus]|uniref:integrin alpha-E-like n=1 Tax=Pangasianodon hypophthalmus TaxID=310915 RepID=UPI002307A735|nr:integrin alpha-E-like [Pangasianodon hypophthalmus]